MNFFLVTIKLTFLFVALFVIIIHSINAKPISVKLFTKRAKGQPPGATDALKYASYIRQSALTKYSKIRINKRDNGWHLNEDNGWHLNKDDGIRVNKRDNSWHLNEDKNLNKDNGWHLSKDDGIRVNKRDNSWHLNEDKHLNKDNGWHLSKDDGIRVNKRDNSWHLNEDNGWHLNKDNGWHSNNKNDVSRNKRQLGKQPCTLLIENDSTVYYGKIMVGNQNFSVLMDTGSSTLFVPNINCTSATCVSGKHSLFDLSKSQTFIPEGNPWTIQYGIGSASGITGKDDVKICELTAKQQIFGLASIISDDLSNLNSDGILGLAFDYNNNLDNGAPTLVSTLATQNQIDPIFSFHLSRAQTVGDQGTFTLGGIGTNKVINYNKVVPLSGNLMVYWLIMLDDLIVDNQPLSFTGRGTIIDTGTSIMLLPNDDAAKFHTQIPGAQLDANSNLYVIPCNTKNVVTLKFGGINYAIQPEDLIINNSAIGGNSCVSAFVGTTKLVGVWIVGVPFLKNVYSVFNATTPPSVGFAL